MIDSEFQNDVLTKLNDITEKLNYLQCNLETMTARRDERVRCQINEWLAEQREAWLDRLITMLGDDDCSDDWWKEGRESP